MPWANEEESRMVDIDKTETLKNGAAHVDLTEGSSQPLRFGEETLFVNAAIMDVRYRPENAPWRIDLDLPLAEKT